MKGARLWSDKEGAASEIALGETDAEGTLPSARATAPRLIVRATGFAPFRGLLTALPVEESARIVRLSRAGIIRGRLVDSGGRPMSVAGTVAVWRADDEGSMSMRQYLGAAVEGGLVATVETDATGQFAYAEADPDLRYSLAAGAPGFVFAGPPNGVRAQVSDPETPLPLEPLYAVVVRLHDPDGGPMEINFEDPSGANLGLGGVDKSGYALVYAGGVVGRLGTMGVPQLGPAENGDYIVPWTFRRNSDEKGPLTFHFKAPAYEHASREVMPTPVAEGVQEVVLQAVRATPRTTKGTVRVRLDTSRLGNEVRAALGCGCTFFPDAPILHFFPEPPGGGGRQRTKPLPFPLPPEVLVDRVEAGAYRVRLYSGGLSVPSSMEPGTVQVVGGGETACTFTVTSAQCLALDVTDAEGRSYEGSLRVTLLSGREILTEHGPGRSCTIGTFLEKPYVFLLVKEGPVDLQVSANGYAETKATATVAPGSVTRCAIQLERK